ncbi:MAG TPA: M28 family peptidase [Herpetosiphonaceae bacterium]
MNFSVTELIDHSLIFIHIIAGCLALLAGIIPMVTHKGGANHRRWGQIYFWSMFVIFITAQIVQIFFRSSLFIFFAANLAFYQAYTGTRAIALKSSKSSGRRRLLDWAMALGALISGLVWIWWSSSPFWSPELAERVGAEKVVSLAVLGTWLGIYTCYWAIADIVRFLRPSKQKQWWWFHHLDAMVNSYGSALVAFTAVNGFRLVPIEYVWLLWVLPGFGFGIGAFIWGLYYRRKFNRKTRVAPALPSLAIAAPARLTALAIVVVALAAGVLSLRAPSALPASSPATEFSAERILPNVTSISQTTHPIGTPEQDQIREYLVAQLQALGVETEVQQATAVVGNVLGGGNVAGTAFNVVGRLPGTQSSFPVVLVAHYDSPPGSYGANDNGVSTGVVLETVRALKAGPPLKNDVIILFSDGEEIGSIGVQAFIDEHRWAAGGGIALNFDSRGSTGPSMMYETNTDNGGIIPIFARTPQPFGNSLTNEVYRRLPFQTDFTIFKRAGWSGLNFAYLDGYPYYQSRLDTPDRVDLRSVQHHGSYALALTRTLGMLDARPQPQPDMVYFDILQSALIYYPTSWVMPLAAIVVVLFAAVLILGARRKHLTYRGVGISALAFLGATIIPVVSIALIWQVILMIHPGYRGALLDVYNNQTYRVAFISLTVALGVVTYGWLFRRLTLLDLATGALVPWLSLMIVAAVAVPGVSYLFMIPLIGMTIGLGLLFRQPAPWERPTIGQAALAALAAVPGIILLFPTLLQLSITLGTNFSTVTGFCVMLLLGLLIVPLRLISLSYERIVWGGGLAIASAGLVYGSLTSGFNAARPQTTNLFYALDADTRQARWVSESDVLDPWLSQAMVEAEYAPLPSVFPASPQWTPLQHDAPPLALAGPEVTLLHESESNGLRTMRLRLVSPRHAPIMRITLGKDLEVISATVNDRPIGDIQAGYKRKSWWELTYFRVPREGIELEVQFKGAAQLEVTAVDRSYGLPENAGIAPRPLESLAAQFPFSIGDVTLVRRGFEFSTDTAGRPAR